MRILKDTVKYTVGLVFLICIFAAGLPGRFPVNKLIHFLLITTSCMHSWRVIFSLYTVPLPVCPMIPCLADCHATGAESGIMFQAPSAPCEKLLWMGGS